MSFADHLMGRNIRKVQASMTEDYNYRRLQEFVWKNGHLPPLTHHDTEMVMWMLRKQRLDEEQRNSGDNIYWSIALPKMLNSKGQAMKGDSVWEWKTADEQFKTLYESLVKYIDENDKMPSDDVLKAWMVEQRSMRGSLPEEHKRLLEALPGWQWNGRFASGKRLRAMIQQERDAGRFPPDCSPNTKDSDPPAKRARGGEPTQDV